MIVHRAMEYHVDPDELVNENYPEWERWIRENPAGDELEFAIEFIRENKDILGNYEVDYEEVFVL